MSSSPPSVSVGVVGAGPSLSLGGGMTMKLFGVPDGSEDGSWGTVGSKLSVGGSVSSVASGDEGVSAGGDVGRGVDDGGLVVGAGVVASVDCGTGPSGAIPPRSQFHSAGGAVDNPHPVWTIQSLW